MPRKRVRKTERGLSDISKYQNAYEEVKRGTSLRRAAEIHEVNRMLNLTQYVDWYIYKCLFFLCCVTI